MFYLSKTKKLNGAGSHMPPPVSFPFMMDFILVGAGGGHTNAQSYAGGGGGGGLICSGQALQGGGGTAQVNIKAPGTYSIVIAAQTVAQTPAIAGSNSTAFGYTADGGGRGGGNDGGGGNGGSGGGGGGNDTGYLHNGGTGTANQGYGGGKSLYGSPTAQAGGGAGGAGGAGGNANGVNYQKGGTGGLGLEWLDGKVYACGGHGSGGGYTPTQGDLPANYPSGGAPNRGFGGQYTTDSSNPGGRGYGSTGVCVVRYPFSNKLEVTGGTKTQDSGFVYHTFITSGTLVVG